MYNQLPEHTLSISPWFGPRAPFPTGFLVPADHEDVSDDGHLGGDSRPSLAPNTPAVPKIDPAMPPGYACTPLAEPRSKPIEAYSSPLSAMLVLRRAERLRMLRVNTLAAMPADKVGQAVREQAQRRPGRKKAKAE
jgi:hypothetical protein